jgi:hypothetical protein
MRDWCAERGTSSYVVPTFAFRVRPSDLLLFILDVLSGDLFLLPMLLLGGLVALMPLFTDLAMLPFENPVSLVFSKVPLILPKAICFSSLNHC